MGKKWFYVRERVKIKLLLFGCHGFARIESESIIQYLELMNFSILRRQTLKSESNVEIK